MRTIDVLTALEDHAETLSDPSLLDRATILGRVLFTRDDDLLIEAKHRQEHGISFGGVIFAHQLRATIGQCVHDLEIIMFIGEEDDIKNQVIFLPL